VSPEKNGAADAGNVGKTFGSGKNISFCFFLAVHPLIDGRIRTLWLFSPADEGEIFMLAELIDVWTLCVVAPTLETLTGKEASTATSPLHYTNQRRWFHAHKSAHTAGISCRLSPYEALYLRPIENTAGGDIGKGMWFTLTSTYSASL